MIEENEKDLFFCDGGLQINLIEEPTPKKRGRKKGSKNNEAKKLKELDDFASLYLANPTDQNFQELWKRSYWGLRQHAFKIVPNNYDVDDIIINVFYIILNKHDQFDPEKGKFSTWMYKICQNECFAYWNKKNRTDCISVDISEIPITSANSDFVDDFDYSDKFDENIDMMDKEEIKRKFFDTSINEVKKFTDERIKNCMLERMCFYDEVNHKKCKPLTLEQISSKYNYPFTSVKNWVIKGKIQLKEAMMMNHSELYEMWRETLD